jgi:hypothetical protein
MPPQPLICLTLVLIEDFFNHKYLNCLGNLASCLKINIYKATAPKVSNLPKVFINIKQLFNEMFARLTFVYLPNLGFVGMIRFKRKPRFRYRIMIHIYLRLYGLVKLLVF